MGRWTKRCGEAVYNVCDNPFKTVYDWGYLSVSSDNSRVYLYVTDADTDTIELSGIFGEVKAVSELGGFTQEFEYDKERGRIKISLKRAENDLPVPVFRIEAEGALSFAERLIQHGNKLYLNSFCGEKYKDGEKTELVYEHNTYSGTQGLNGLAISKTALITSWQSASECISWTADFTEAADYDCEVTLGNGNYSAEVTVELTDADGNVQSCDALLSNTGALRSYSLSRTGYGNVRFVCGAGRFTVKAPGTCKITLKRKANGVNLPVADVSFVRV